MKKYLLAVALTVVVSGSAFAAGDAHRNTGCGLGTMLWEGKADNSILFQVFQATTNGSTGTQTFGISSGTSNCDQPSKIVKNEKLNEFVRANLDNLARDIAMGKGETLDTFVEMLGIPQSESKTFNAKLQANFDRIFTSDKVILAEVVDNAIMVANQ